MIRITDDFVAEACAHLRHPGVARADMRAALEAAAASTGGGSLPAADGQVRDFITALMGPLAAQAGAGSPLFEAVRAALGRVV